MQMSCWAILLSLAWQCFGIMSPFADQIMSSSECLGQNLPVVLSWVVLLLFLVKLDELLADLGRFPNAELEPHSLRAFATSGEATEPSPSGVPIGEYKSLGWLVVFGEAARASCSNLPNVNPNSLLVCMCVCVFVCLR